jgi:hypothetical protein
VTVRREPVTFAGLLAISLVGDRLVEHLRLRSR